MRKKLNQKNSIVFWASLLLWVVLAGSPYSAPAQDRMDEQAWEEATEGRSYGDTERQKEEKEENEVLKNDSISDSSWGISLNPTLVKVILISLVVVLLAFVLVKLLGSNIGSGKLKKKELSFSLEDIEENLEETDLERFKREALQKEDYKTAIRIFYLMIIKSLSETGKIKWRREKTNRQFVQEMRRKDGYKKFRDITLSFEIVWYGNAPFSARDYQTLLPEFSQFLENIQKDSGHEQE